MDDRSHVYNLHFTLDGELGVKELSAMIVRKGERPVGKKRIVSARCRHCGLSNNFIIARLLTGWLLVCI